MAPDLQDSGLTLLHRLDQRRVDGFDGGLDRIGSQVGGTLDRSRLGMAQQFADHWQTQAQCRAHARENVAQVGQVCPLADPIPGIGQAHQPRAALVVTDHQGITGVAERGIGGWQASCAAGRMAARGDLGVLRSNRYPFSG